MCEWEEPRGHVQVVDGVGSAAFSPKEYSEFPYLFSRCLYLATILLNEEDWG